MRPKLLAMRPVALLMVPLLAAAALPAAADPPWVAQVVGRYVGSVRNAGAMECHRTEFAVQDGHLVGHYWIEDGDPFDGTLTGFVPESGTSGHFTWTDRYGSGTEFILFSTDWGRFTGAWGADQVNPANPVYGKRGGSCASSAVSSRDAAPNDTVPDGVVASRG